MNLDYLRQINLQKKIIALNVLLLLFVGIIIFFIIVPSISEIKAMRNEIETQRLDLEDKYVKGQSLKKLSENLKMIEPQLNKLDQVFINQNRELEFITTLEAVASGNGITQKIDLAPAKGADSGFFKKIPLQLYTQGSFFKQMKYLSELESLNYYININLIELSSARPLSEATYGLNEGGGISLLLAADTFWK